MSLNFRTVNKPENPKGLAIGFLVGSQVDSKLRDAMQEFTVIATDKYALTPTAADLREWRKLAPSAPLYLFAWSAGVQTIRAILRDRLADPAGVAVFDGTSANYPTAQAWQIDTWRNAAERARRGEMIFAATCTSMGYTERLAVNPYMSTRHVLEQVLGHTLEIGSPVIDGSLYVERFSSTDCDTEAHERQLNTIAPIVLKECFKPLAASVPPVPWLDPFYALGERLVLWASNEYGSGVSEEPPGSNDSTRIREYFAIDYMRDGHPIAINRAPWCAAFACYGLHTVKLPGDTIPIPRVSGIELENDAKASKRWAEPKAWRRNVGDLAILSRPGAAWNRHVAIVIRPADETGRFATIAGNENGTICIAERRLTDPDLRGFCELP